MPDSPHGLRLLRQSVGCHESICVAARRAAARALVRWPRGGRLARRASSRAAGADLVTSLLFRPFHTFTQPASFFSLIGANSYFMFTTYPHTPEA